jgi:hypothetical protein
MEFEQIAPAWSRILKQDRLDPWQLSLLARPARCVVGEAYGGKSDYGCKICCEFGNAFYRDVWMNLNHNLVNNTITNFVKHWNDAHAKSDKHAATH